MVSDASLDLASSPEPLERDGEGMEQLIEFFRRLDQWNKARKEGNP
jgi:hypothetical protein